MNRHSIDNGRLAVQLDGARYCLADLAQRGLHIIRVELGTLPDPLVVLDAPYLEPGGLTGGRKRIEIRNGARRETYATRHMECQVEWEVPA